MSEKIYDVIIIGGGPAGLSAAIYARRSELETLVVEKGVYGGLLFQTAGIENYPGGIKGESGADFSMRLVAQAESFGFEKVMGEVSDVSLEGSVKTVTISGKTYSGKTVIIATGNLPVLLNIPGEAEYTGKGVSYCATCDGPLFRGRDVYVIGGGNAAVEESLHLAHFARKVTIMHRRDRLRANKYIQEKALNTQNISFLFDTTLEEIKGSEVLGSIVVKNVKSGETYEITAPEADGIMGVFVFAGMAPQTALFEGKLHMENGYILTDEEMHTSVPGVFAAGDVRKKSLRQAVTAVSDGAVAAVEAEKYLE
ncbi:MAG: thioredoxin-disulfide reductase [Clostridiales Family XIII bacterium]|jgi:thioredoxin reductase (NADPH)|nr:thioredoxin-disulfide reductase [Clostridiales Family XIII bacterium]